MTKFIFVRHGETEWNKAGRFQGQSDVSLSEKGFKQAEILAAHFPVDKVDAIYSSDLIRARNTAEAIARTFKIEVQTKKELRELHFGDWEGLTYDEIVGGWPDALANFLRHPDILEVPNGETFSQVQDRAMAAIMEIAKHHEGETVVVTAHGGILRTVLTTVMHIPLRYLWSIRQFNTAVSIACYDEAGWIIELVNSTAHLKYLKQDETAPTAFPITH